MTWIREIGGQTETQSGYPPVAPRLRPREPSLAPDLRAFAKIDGSACRDRACSHDGRSLAGRRVARPARALVELVGSRVAGVLTQAAELEAASRIARPTRAGGEAERGARIARSIYGSQRV